VGFSPLLPTRSCYPPQADDFGGVFSKRKKKKNSLWKNSREGNLPTPLDSQAFLAAEGWIDQFTREGTRPRGFSSWEFSVAFGPRWMFLYAMSFLLRSERVLGIIPHLLLSVHL